MAGFGRDAFHKCVRASNDSSSTRRARGDAGRPSRRQRRPPKSRLLQVERDQTRKEKSADRKEDRACRKNGFLDARSGDDCSNNVNVRGQATLKSEVVTRLDQGDAVTVLEQINLEKHKTDEPAQWAKIALPASAHVWVHACFH